MSRPKVLLISFFVVFVLFALLAFFTGSSLFWSLFKALVSACLATVFLLVSNFFLLKYIPDFFEDKPKEETPDADVVGANLDIRIGDTSNPSLKQTTETPASQTETSFDSVGSTDFAGGLQGDNLLEEDSFRGGDSSSSNFRPLNFSSEEKAGSDLSNTEKIDAEENEGNYTDETKSSEAELSETTEKDGDRLEELPDLQEFVDTSKLQEDQTKGDELMNTGTQSFFATDLSDDVTDTNLMAKAIRTVLKREV